MKQLRIFILSFVFLTCYNSSVLAQVDKKLLNSIFKLEVEYTELKKAHGADPKKAEILRKTFKEQHRQGSGFVIEHNGKKYLLTCLHVVEGTDATHGIVIAKDKNGKRYTMKLIGADTFYDIAILAFETPLSSNVQPLKIKKTAVQSGQAIKTIGYPDGKVQPLSGKTLKHEENFEREIGGYGFVRTTMNLKSGISGSPIMNTQDEVVGIASRAAKSSKTSYGLFLQSEIMQSAINRMFQDEKSKEQRIKRLFTGVVFAQRKKLNGKLTKVYIKDILPNSPAASVLKGYKNYTIVSLQNQKISKLSDIYKVLEPLKGGTTLHFEIEKDSNSKQYKKSVKTKDLTDSVLEQIADFHIGKENKIVPNYYLSFRSASEGHNMWLYEKSSNERLFKVTIGGYEAKSKVIRYVMYDKKDIGILVRLCSDSGTLILMNSGVTKTKSVRNYKDENVTLRLIYY